MKKRLLLVALAVPICGAALLGARSGSLVTAKGVDRALLEQALAAWGTRDVSQAAKFYAKDANLIFFDVAPRKYTGWTEYAAGANELFKTTKSISFKILDDVAVHNDDDAAWSVASVDVTLVGNDGSAMTFPCRWTAIWEKRGDQWLMVHDHMSVPLPPPGS